MALIHTPEYTIPIPAPAMQGGELEQLAQIIVPDGKVVAVFWMRSTRQAVSQYDGKWFIQSDQNIMTAITRLIKYGKNIDLLTMENLFIFENPGHGLAADDELVRHFRDCEWSDYASDRMAFQCTIREKNIVEKNTIDQSKKNKIAYDVQAKNAENLQQNLPPVLTRAPECCCTGCHKNTETTKTMGVDKNKKW